MPQLDRSHLDLAPDHLLMLQTLLSRYVPQAEVWAFGSRVNGDGHEGSDLDLVLRNPTDLAQALDGWLDLTVALQESSLPMLVEAHDWAHLPAAFHRNMAQRYVVLQPGCATGVPHRILNAT